MIEKIVIDFLSEALSAIDVYAEQPEEKPETYLLVQKTGGGEENKIASATIAVQSYATTLYDAAELNEAVVETMQDLTDVDAVTLCNLNSDYNFTDTAQKRYRYQAVFDIFYYRGG